MCLQIWLKGEFDMISCQVLHLLAISILIIDGRAKVVTDSENTGHAVYAATVLFDIGFQLCAMTQSWKKHVTVS